MTERCSQNHWRSQRDMIGRIWPIAGLDCSRAKDLVGGTCLTLIWRALRTLYFAVLNSRTSRDDVEWLGEVDRVLDELDRAVSWPIEADGRSVERSRVWKDCCERWSIDRGGLACRSSCGLEKIVIEGRSIAGDSRAGLGQPRFGRRLALIPCSWSFGKMLDTL